jgi:hypothetical protein
LSWAWLKVPPFKCAAAKAISLGCLCAAPGASAIIFYSSGDPEKNTTAPAGAYIDSGWDFTGNWGVFQGTAIGPRHFITASHIGGAVGQAFEFQGANFTTVSTTKDPESDLQIWEVSGAFPVYAPLFDGNETSQEMIFFGRGVVRGGEVQVNGALKGWLWGGWDGRLRWGHNVVADLVDNQGQAVTLAPLLIKATFDANGGTDEAHLGGGDSGGGVFIKQSNLWRLAGVNFTVDGPFNDSASGPGFSAALFDIGGMYTGSEGNWRQILDTPLSQPSSLYATRIKPRLAWIQSVLNQPATPSVVEASDVIGPFTASTGATVDTATKTIRVPLSAAHYFQLQSGTALHITSVHLENGMLVLQYE